MLFSTTWAFLTFRTFVTISNQNLHSGVDVRLTAFFGFTCSNVCFHPHTFNHMHCKPIFNPVQGNYYMHIHELHTGRLIATSYIKKRKQKGSLLSLMVNLTAVCHKLNTKAFKLLSAINVIL